MRTESISWALSPITKLFGFLAVLGLVALGLFSYYVWLVLSDNLGIFHNTADLADLDGDGDVDVILHNVRTESEFTAFAGTTLWFNQGDGQFVARRNTVRIQDGHRKESRQNRTKPSESLALQAAVDQVSRTCYNSTQEVEA